MSPCSVVINNPSAVCPKSDGNRPATIDAVKNGILTPNIANMALRRMGCGSNAAQTVTMNPVKTFRSRLLVELHLQCCEAFHLKSPVYHPNTGSRTKAALNPMINVLAQVCIPMVKNFLMLGSSSAKEFHQSDAFPQQYRYPYRSTCLPCTAKIPNEDYGARFRLLPVSRRHTTRNPRGSETCSMRRTTISSLLWRCPVRKLKSQRDPIAKLRNFLTGRDAEAGYRGSG